jgi:hypothetical protein
VLVHHRRTNLISHWNDRFRQACEVHRLSAQERNTSRFSRLNSFLACPEVGPYPSMMLNKKGRRPAPPFSERLDVCSSLATASRRAGLAALRADLNPAEPCSLRSCAGGLGRHSSPDGGLLLNPQIVLHVPDARDLLGNVLGPPLGVAVVDRAQERHFAGRHAHFDLGGVDKGIVAQPVVDVLADAVIRLSITHRFVLQS